MIKRERNFHRLSSVFIVKRREILIAEIFYGFFC